MRKSFPSTLPDSEHGGGLEAESAIENLSKTLLPAGVQSRKARTSTSMASPTLQTRSKPSGFHNFNRLRVEPCKVNEIMAANADVCSTRKKVYRGPRMG